MPGPNQPALPGFFVGPPTPFRPVDALGNPKSAAGVGGAPLAAPTIRYVRTTGSNSNGGTSPSDAWLTVTKALTTVGSNTTVYVGAGVYRETVSVTITPTSLVSVIGDVTGQFTGDAGMVQLTAYLTNDKTAPSGTTLLNLNGKSNLSFSNIMFVGGNATIVTATTATSQNITFSKCAFYGYGITGRQVISATSAYGVQFNWMLDSCYIIGSNINGVLLFTLTTGLGGSDYDSNVLIKNCVSFGAGSTFLLVTNSGVLTYKGGGVRVRNHFHYGPGGGFIATTAAQISLSIACSVYNSIIFSQGSTSLSAGTSGQMVEDYNVINATAARSNVAIGAHSISDGSYAPLFHFGQELQWGGTLRPFGEPMQSSPLRAFGAQDTSAGPLDIRGGPRPSDAPPWDVGAYQRGNSAVQQTVTTQAGLSAISFTGSGFFDMNLPVDVVLNTVQIYVQYNSSYQGPLPQLQILENQQCGVGGAQVLASTNALNAFELLTVQFTPTATGIVTIRVVSGDTSGVATTIFDTMFAN